MSDSSLIKNLRVVPREAEFLDRRLGSKGEIFYDQNHKTLRLFDGTVLGGTELAKTDLSNIGNDAFLAKATSAGVGTTGGGGNTTVTVGDTLPAEPENGNLWLDTNNGYLYVYIDDGDTSQWVQPAFPTPSGSYDDLTDKPTIPSNVSDLTNDAGYISSIPDTINASIFSTDSTLLVDAENGKLIGDLETVDPIISGTINSSDSSTITFTPAVVMSSNLTVENNLVVSNDITVRNLTVSENIVNPTFSGTISGITASDVGLGNVTNESKETMFASPEFTGTTSVTGTLRTDTLTSLPSSTAITVTGSLIVGQTVEKMSTATSIAASADFDFDQGTIWFLYDLTNDFTANFINVPSDIESTISFAFIINQQVNPYLPTEIEINGSAQTILWQDGSQPLPNAESTDIVSFTLIYTGSSWEVLGSLATYS